MMPPFTSEEQRKGTQRGGKESRPPTKAVREEARRQGTRTPGSARPPGHHVRAVQQAGHSGAEEEAHRVRPPGPGGTAQRGRNNKCGGLELKHRRQRPRQERRPKLSHRGCQQSAICRAQRWPTGPAVSTHTRSCRAAHRNCARALLAAGATFSPLQGGSGSSPGGLRLRAAWENCPVRVKGPSNHLLQGWALREGQVLPLSSHQL